MFKVNKRNTDENAEYIFLNTISTATIFISNITGVIVISLFARKVPYLHSGIFHISSM